MGKSKSLFLMTTFASVLAAAGVDTPQLLKKIEDRYNHIQTLQVSFVQTYTPPRGRARTPEKGTLLLRKPGRMRWQYASPAGKLWISDGSNVFSYDPEENRAQAMKLKDVEDLRAPLAFLLGKLNFKDDFGRIEASPQGDAVSITAFPKSDQSPYTEVSFLVTRDSVIQQLSVKDQDGSLMHYEFDGEKLNPAIPDSMFHFTPPPGVEVIKQ